MCLNDWSVCTNISLRFLCKMSNNSTNHLTTSNKNTLNKIQIINTNTINNNNSHRHQHSGFVQRNEELVTGWLLYEIYINSCVFHTFDKIFDINKNISIWFIEKHYGCYRVGVLISIIIICILILGCVPVFVGSEDSKFILTVLIICMIVAGILTFAYFEYLRRRAVHMRQNSIRGAYSTIERKNKEQQVRFFVSS